MNELSKTVQQLEALQQPNGGYLSYSSPHADLSKAFQFSTIFSNALILEQLSYLPNTSALRQIKTKLAHFLLNQKSPDWSFNYWDRQSVEYKTLPYPDDLDDTFCALTALLTYRKELLTGSVLANIVTLLTKQEVQIGGPYRTWCVENDAPKQWQDVDLGVNSNIAYFLSLQKIELPKLNRYISQVIKSQNIQSPYYPEKMVLLFFLSRFYQGRFKQRLRDQIYQLQTKNDQWSNPLTTALAILALTNLGFPLQNSAVLYDLLLDSRQNNLWRAYPFYRGVNPIHQERFYAGSAALTTVFCAHALIVLKTKKSPSSQPQLSLQNKLHRQIIKQVKKQFLALRPETARPALKIVNKIIGQNISQEITTLPLIFAQALDQPFSKDLLTELGKASLYGWIAYTIYDDFFDSEGRIEALPVAAIALRHLTVIFQTNTHNDFMNLFTRIMDKLDQANSWEITNCRFDQKKMLNNQRSLPKFGEYTILAEKSLGHALSPLALVSLLGYSSDSPEMKDCYDLFCHYIIAKQLNDDAHDFVDDLHHGILTPVGVAIITALRKQPLSPKNFDQTIQQLFWNEVVVQISDLVIYHSHRAKEALKRSNIITKKELLVSLIDRYQQAAQTALAQRKQMLDFLQAYH